MAHGTIKNRDEVALPHDRDYEAGLPNDRDYALETMRTVTAAVTRMIWMMIFYIIVTIGFMGYFLYHTFMAGAVWSSAFWASITLLLTCYFVYGLVQRIVRGEL
ncbi:MAG: hypothetical protein MJE68_23240 [Proteobacteria bacterium]|nr:hypothetical protein [Pseudomonadota bacterium]